MKKLFLFSVLVFVWNCRSGSLSIKSAKNGVGLIEEEIKFKTDYKNSSKNVLIIAPLENKQITDNLIFDRIHKISDTMYEQNVAVYKKSINQGGNSYYVMVLQNDNRFKKLIDSLNDNKIEDEYIKFNLPKTKIAKDITYSKAENGFCDFADGVSVYHEKFLKYLLSKNPKELKIVKGRETIDRSKYDSICSKKTKINAHLSEFTEAQIYLLLNDGTEKYYNLSHIPPGNINLIKDKSN
ncbi:hypothetical protein [Chryseobacterium gambrini]|uniref:Uncharacterized protein n=1 Tax=Chryseobacterium gambrini TaxID=373672 RepID=A0A1N7NYN5_9FLAO|nr:hypothetical protein [Chryseobacterium gambrini]SIT03443.1 hypothetical protein SAMN05421785_105223 [Chryseobacterium gambrini]